MKRLLSFALSIVLACCVCVSAGASGMEVLEGMSYDDLCLLSALVNLEITSRPEWKSTTVPAGQWRVGMDIPFGFFSLSCEEDVDVHIWRVAIGDYSNQGLFFSEYMDPGDYFGRIELQEGWIFETSGPVILGTPETLTF